MKSDFYQSEKYLNYFLYVNFMNNNFINLIIKNDLILINLKGLEVAVCLGKEIVVEGRFFMFLINY